MWNYLKNRIDDQANKLWHAHMMEFYAVIKKIIGFNDTSNFSE